MECTKKIYYSTKQAQTAVNSAHKSKFRSGKRVKNRAKKIPVRYYKCPDCKLFHLTSQQGVSY